MMRLNQKGATLLEAILAAAVMGMVMAYSGTIILKEAERKATIKAANEIINMQLITHKYTQDMIWETTDSANKNIVNPIFEQTAVGKAYYSGIGKYKNQDCNSSYGIPDNVVNEYMSCGYNVDAFPIQYVGVNAFFSTYTNLRYPTIKRRVDKIDVVYASVERGEVESGLRIVAEISQLASLRGVDISDTQIFIKKFRNDRLPNVGSYQDVGFTMNYQDFISDPENIVDYEEDLKSKDYVFGFQIVNDDVLNDSLKADGSIPMNYEGKLCWDARDNLSRPCITTVTHHNHAKDKDTFLFNSGVTYRTNKKYKTPPEISYHTFSNGNNVEIPIIKCVEAADTLELTNKIILVPSSFSSGSESGTNFTNPGNIVSKGTKGADGQHSLITGLSLEYTKDRDKWVVSASIGIDAAYADQNGDSSVLRNPSSISFAAIRWCEE